MSFAWFSEQIATIPLHTDNYRSVGCPP